MMTIEQIIEALRDRKLTAVADGAGLSYDTVWRVASGNSRAVSYETIRKLSDYLQGRKNG